MINTIAAVGSGLAGVRAVQMLRAEGFGGRIFLIGDEPHHPYDRPSLSKDVLSGVIGLPPPLVEHSWLEDQRIELLAGEEVERLDAGSRRLYLKSGATVSSDLVLLATGARARSLPVPGSSLDGVFTLRSLDDSRLLQRELRPDRSLVVVGGGLIGCEVATTARGAGLDVTIVEAGAELMQRVMDPATARWCRAALERQGVAVRLNAGVVAFEGAGGVRSVVCTDGERLPADLVLVSVGAEPRAELGIGAGLACDRGVLVDAAGATSCAHVFAAGDVASWPLAGGGRRSFETYLNSQAQAAVAARAMLGKPVAGPQSPLSWTKIAGHDIQIAGDLAGAGEIVLRGDPALGAFLAFRLHEGKLIACVSANSPKEFPVARRLVEAKARLSRDELRDPDTRLRDLLAASQRTEPCLG